MKSLLPRPRPDESWGLQVEPESMSFMLGYGRVNGRGFDIKVLVWCFEFFGYDPYYQIRRLLLVIGIGLTMTPNVP